MTTIETLLWLNFKHTVFKMAFNTTGKITEVAINTEMKLSILSLKNDFT